MPTTKCCSKRSRHLSKIATRKAKKVAGIQAKKGHPKKASANKATPKKSKKACRACKHKATT